MSTTQKMLFLNECGGLILRKTFCPTILFMTRRQKVQSFFTCTFTCRMLMYIFVALYVIIRHYYYYYYYIINILLLLIIIIICREVWRKANLFCSKCDHFLFSLALKLLTILRLTVIFFP